MPKTKSDIEAKIEAAREAVDQAAALLLEHAEGLAALAMIARASDLQGPQTITLKDARGPMVIRNVEAERAYAMATETAVLFAGRFEAFIHARDMMSSIHAMVLREAVEDLVGPDGGMPPALPRMPAKVGGAELGITPEAVHTPGLAEPPHGLGGEGQQGQAREDVLTMSTQYTVHARDGFEICLNEMSNEFNVMLKASDEAYTRHIGVWGLAGGPAVRTAGAYARQDMTVDEVVAMAVEMIRVASCWVYAPRTLLDAAALKVMELAEHTPVVDPVDADEMAAALAPLFATVPTRDSDLPAVVSPCA